MRLRTFPPAILLLLVAAALSAHAGALLEPEPAPEWEVSEWINGDPGQLADQRGRVVVIEFFQLWCPGCRSFSIPLFNEWAEEYRDRDDVLIVSIHTVFEGHEFQSPERLHEFVKIWNIDHPVGIDAYASPDDDRPVTMTRFGTGGTPHVAIVDKDGQLRFSHFGRFDPKVVERFIERLAKEGDEAPRQAKSQDAKPTRPKTRKPRARSGGGLSRRGQPGAGTDPDNDERDGASDDIAGNYTATFEQSSKSCGETDAPGDFDVTLMLRGGKITARFSRAYMGFRTLLADFDERSGSFEAKLQRRTRAAGTSVSLELQLRGQFDMLSDPKRFDYALSLEKSSEDGVHDCSIEGEGSGTHK